MLENEMLPDLTPHLESAPDYIQRTVNELHWLNHRLNWLTFWFGFVVGAVAGSIFGTIALAWFLSR